MILLLDNYDSFVYNLARYFEELGEDVLVVRNDAVGPEDVGASAPTHVVISPGPCTPAEAGVSTATVRALAGAVPILGVCLGHQCIGAAFGADVVRAVRPLHGKLSMIGHSKADLFAGLPSPLLGTRYHSLVVDASSLPESLKPTAWADDGSLMAMRHVDLPIWGVQFHPEAVLTEHGHALLNNFLVLGRGGDAAGLAAPLPEPEGAAEACRARQGLSAR